MTIAAWEWVADTSAAVGVKTIITMARISAADRVATVAVMNATRREAFATATMTSGAIMWMVTLAGGRKMISDRDLWRGIAIDATLTGVRHAKVLAATIETKMVLAVAN